MKKILTSLALLGLFVAGIGAAGTGAIAAEEAHNAAAPTH
ncbi:MAG: cytochrome c1, partial [Mesorhizobium sp.]